MLLCYSSVVLLLISWTFAMTSNFFASFGKALKYFKRRASNGSLRELTLGVLKLLILIRLINPLRS